MPNDKAFIYQSLLDLSGLHYPEGPVIRYQELRQYLRNHLGLPLDTDDDPAQEPPQPPQMPMEQPMEEMPPGPPADIPPEALQAIMEQMQQPPAMQQQVIPMQGGAMVG